MRSSTKTGGIAGYNCGCALAVLVFNLLLGSTAAKYCLLHWLPAISKSVPNIHPLDPNISVWSPLLILLGLFGAEIFVPGAIITWLLIALGIVS